MNKIFKTESAFTLLELLVTIAIIAILIALGTVSYSAAQKKSRDARRRSDIKEIQNALESFYALQDPNNYPGDTPADFPTEIDNDTYFPSGVPTDPKLGTNYQVSVYTTDAYTVCADLEADGTFDGTNCDISVSSLQ
jgi:prepilin-type N-terminal cleavage/methylation domain-containing protein